uniref:C3a anaphylatoxin chemotactic receptor-like n=1 Tax=Euleptes europaea TaxID=460621 RepID=UPI0025402C16|nr:C3a anaphylatoxin chemotactic receptor-like [Euleptes europaea]
MNTSTTHLNDTTSSVDEAMRQIAIATNVIILVLGVFGNGLVVWVTAMRKKRYNFTSTCYLNLAMADLLFSLGRIPALVQEIMYSRWPFGNPLCKLHAFARYLTVFAGVFILTLISVDRCLLVAQPVWTRNHRGPRFQALMCVGAWILALAFSAPYLVVREVTLKDGAMYCGYRKDLRISTELPLRLSRFFGGFLVPFIIILSAYLVLVFKLRRRRWEGSHRTFTLVATIVVLFFICWLPHHVVALISTIGGSKEAWGIPLKLSNALAYLHSCINPVIYVLVGYIRIRSLHRRASFLGLFRKALTEEDENSTGAEVTRSLNQKTKEQLDTPILVSPGKPSKQGS